MKPTISKLKGFGVWQCKLETPQNLIIGHGLNPESAYLAWKISRRELSQKLRKEIADAIRQL